MYYGSLSLEFSIPNKWTFLLYGHLFFSYSPLLTSLFFSLREMNVRHVMLAVADLIATVIALFSFALCELNNIKRRFSSATTV